MDARNCDRCGCESEVIDVRSRPDGTVRRRRKCPQCGNRWSTIERMRPEFAVQQEYDEFLGKWEIKVFEDGEMVFKGYRKHKIKDTIEFLNQVDLLRNG